MREVLQMTFETYKKWFKQNENKFDCANYNHKDGSVTVFWKR